MEDYNADFLIMLETWEAAINYLGKSEGYPFSPPRGGRITQNIEIARELGWTIISEGRGEESLSPTARACSSAHALIEGGWSKFYRKNKGLLRRRGPDPARYTRH